MSGDNCPKGCSHEHSIPAINQGHTVINIACAIVCSV